MVGAGGLQCWSQAATCLPGEGKRDGDAGAGGDDEMRSSPLAPPLV